MDEVRGIPVNRISSSQGDKELLAGMIETMRQRGRQSKERIANGKQLAEDEKRIIQEDIDQYLILRADRIERETGKRPTDRPVIMFMDTVETLRQFPEPGIQTIVDVRKLTDKARERMIELSQKMEKEIEEAEQKNETNLDPGDL